MFMLRCVLTHSNTESAAPVRAGDVAGRSGDARLGINARRDLRAAARETAPRADGPATHSLRAPYSPVNSNRTLT